MKETVLIERLLRAQREEGVDQALFFPLPLPRWYGDGA